jgi:hypothetical protein
MNSAEIAKKDIENIINNKYKQELYYKFVHNNHSDKCECLICINFYKSKSKL